MAEVGAPVILSLGVAGYCSVLRTLGARALAAGTVGVIVATVSAAVGCVSATGPDRLAAAVSARGARAFVADATEDEWQGLLRGIRAADPKYLGIAVTLLPVSDAEAAETLAIAIQDGLIRKPECVLSVIPTRTACGLGSAGEDADTFTEEIAVARHVAARVTSVSDPRLQQQRAECLTTLSAEITRLQSSVARP